MMKFNLSVKSHLKVKHVINMHYFDGVRYNNSRKENETWCYFIYYDMAVDAKIAPKKGFQVYIKAPFEHLSKFDEDG